MKESDTSCHKSIKYCRITNVCQAHVLLLFSKSPGLFEKDRMHSSIDNKMGLDARKSDFGAYKQQRCRSVFVSTQSDQRLYCSLIRKFNTKT